MWTLIIFLVILSILVFVHEFGHFIVARAMGVTVEEFGFGFPPRLVGWQRGDTVYSINWIPLGGFVRLKGESGEVLHHHDSFAVKSIWRRAVVIVAGVCMNLLLAIAIFTVGFIHGLPQQIEELPAAAHVRDAEIAVSQVLESSPAETAGLATGDIITAINGQQFSRIEDVQRFVREHDGAPLALVIRRPTGTVALSVVPHRLEKTGTVGMGVGLVAVGTVSYPWYLAPVRAVQLTLGLARAIVMTFGHIIKEFVTTGRSGIDVSGPVGIAVLSGRAAALGISYLAQFVAVLSINLAVINTIPFPSLDGGRLLFLIIESIRRRPVSARIESSVHQIGFALLIMLVIIVTYRDVVRFSDTLIGGLKNLF